MSNLSYRWKAHPGAAELEHTVDQLRSENIRLRDQLRAKQTALGGLELALQARHQTIDQLNARLEQSREQCRRLDAEAENYFRMLAAG
jgi:predicted  nucleic acid-binding Zn-ribbon protein